MELTGHTFFFQWEVNLIIWLQAHMGSFGTSLASILSEFGEELVCVAVIGFLYWCYDKRFGRFVGLNVLVGLVLNPMIKNIYLRRRPYFDTPEIKCLKPIKKDADMIRVSRSTGDKIFFSRHAFTHARYISQSRSSSSQTSGTAVSPALKAATARVCPSVMTGLPSSSFTGMG